MSSSSSRTSAIKRSPARDFLHIISRKKLIYDGTIRLTESMSYPMDEFLEEKARSNEFFRCCLHEWSWYEDDSLWDTYHEVIKSRHPMYVDGETITDMGWKFVRQRFTDHNGHFALINILSTRINEITQKKDGSVVVNAENPITDVQHCILYKRWHTNQDGFLSEKYKELNIIDGKKKEFFNIKDWQYIQQQFTAKFLCCPTLTQLQARMRIVLSQM
ncbi:hypothetical protein KFK09_006353 [Dendrobium nobile]|uniref:Uncharacterized protein n=1 Tax=Dendrobium nobile TaxID=94219 RepID=A0A8T3BRX3_DENNO|nr:hypothetical protein KFK09_006353 [Dendrobium nobile]